MFALNSRPALRRTRRADTPRPTLTRKWRVATITFATLLVSAVVVHQLYFARPAAAAINVFINEIHYDNTGTDAGEAIEIAGPAGTNLAG